MDPIRVLLRKVPSRDKTFSRFQKGLSPPLNFKVPTPFSRNNKMERISNVPYSGSVSQISSGGLGLRPRFRKGYHWTPGVTLWLLSRLKCWLPSNAQLKPPTQILCPHPPQKMNFKTQKKNHLPAVNLKI